ncbi:MAG: hypothetical protein JXQ90_16160 [Cyclobacteriaceae bacterium]
MNIVIKYITVYLAAAVRFFLGPTLGIGYGFGILITTILTVLGMMSTVYLFSYFGNTIHHYTVKWFFKKKRKFTPRNRKFVKIWKQYGLKGVAFFTPIVLSPVLGALLCNVVGGKKSEILKWMWISAVFWALLESTAFYFAGDAIRKFLD